jgi:RNA polymerase primary sigma factor
MFKTQYQLQKRLGRAPKKEEIAEEMSVPLEKVVEMFKIAKHTLSLEMPIHHEADSVLGDYIEDTETPNPNEIAFQGLLTQNMDEVLDKIPVREGRVIRMRYGLPDGRTYTLQEIGDKLGVTRERIRQLQVQGLRRLSPHILEKFRGYFVTQ